MSIKPCPACESADYVNFDCCFEESMEYRRECTKCGACGPWAETLVSADAAWNALPRRGDELVWRKEPPDEPGWWWKRLRYSGGGATSPWAVEIGDIKAEAMFYGELAGRYEWSGPIPKPPATDAEKEADDVL